MGPLTVMNSLPEKNCNVSWPFAFSHKEFVEKHKIKETDLLL